MNLIPVGLQLTVYGMGIVFLLLALMAILISLLLKFDRQPVTEPSPIETETAVNDSGKLDAQTIAAITVAVMQHRNASRKPIAPAMRPFASGTLPSRTVIIGRTNQISSWQSHRRS